MRSRLIEVANQALQICDRWRTSKIYLVFAQRNGTLLLRALTYGAFGAVLSWSFTTLAVAAKNVMTSVPDYLVIETAFTAVQWAMVGPLTALAFGQITRSSDRFQAPNVTA